MNWLDNTCTPAAVVSTTMGMGNLCLDDFELFFYMDNSSKQFRLRRATVDDRVGFECGITYLNTLQQTGTDDPTSEYKIKFSTALFTVPGWHNEI